MKDHLTSMYFQEEAREHWTAVADEADQELVVVRAEGHTEALLRAANELELAGLIGIPARLAPVLGIAIYSSIPAHREKAMEILLRHLDRHARVKETAA